MNEIISFFLENIAGWVEMVHRKNCHADPCCFLALWEMWDPVV